MDDFEFGYVKWWNEQKGYGVIIGRNNDSVFIHKSNILKPKGERYINLEEGEHVRFLRKIIENKLCAEKLTIQRKIKQIKKNTLNFEPITEDCDLQIKFGLQEKYGPNDVVIINNLFSKNQDIMNRLIRELNLSDSNNSLLIPWHEKSHFIANDTVGWKQESPTFNFVIDLIKEAFKMKSIGATRLNYYRQNDYKPCHHDAAAKDPEKAKVQNITIALSFGSTKDVIFENSITGNTVSIQIKDCYIYTFGSYVNLAWRHGIKQTQYLNSDCTEDRISIICWGSVE